MTMKTTVDIYLFLISLTNLMLLYVSADSGSVIAKCTQQCTMNMGGTADSTSGACDSQCLIRECQKGCLVWRRAIATKCLDACTLESESSISGAGSQHCVSGCNIAVDIYAQEIKDSLADISRPEPELTSVTNQSVTLNWDSALTVTFNVTFHLQMAVILDPHSEQNYSEVDNNWVYHDLGDWFVHQRSALVKGLRPFTNYQFRIVVEIVNGRHKVISPPSILVFTEAYGKPTEPPIIKSITPQPKSIVLRLQPPPFINAPLFGYRVNLSTPDRPYSRLKMKEIAAHSRGVTTDVITRLTPNTRYVLSISVINEKGDGPANTTEVVTPPPIIDETVPYLIVAEDNKVVKKHIKYIYYSPTLLYECANASSIIQGVAIHFARKLLFVSERDGHVYRQEGDNTSSVYNAIQGYCGELDVDWLNDKLYIAETNKIVQCNLNGTSCVLVRNHLIDLQDIKVDPANGYLFWAQHGPGLGIYRIDLADVHNQTKPPLHVVQADVLETMAIDFNNYQMFYANAMENTIMSTNLDGTGEEDIRRNVQNPEYLPMKRMTQHQDLFYWTVGGIVYAEDIDTSNDRIFHNSMFVNTPMPHRYTGLNVWHPTSQPVPAPLNEPKNVQVIFTTDTALLTWLPPDINQGRGSWNTWHYEVEVINMDSGMNTSHPAGRDTELLLESLHTDVVYRFTVRAFSSTGRGPWSYPFVGQTLKLEDRGAHLLAVDEENLLHNFTLNGQPAHLLQQYVTHADIAQLEVIGNHVLWCTVSGQMYSKELHSQTMAQLPAINDVKVFAHDWLGNTLYWVSRRPATMIKRMRLDAHGSSLPEVVLQEIDDYPIRGIVVDSLSGYIYWHTERSLEVARLNGQESDNIHREDELYSERYVISLTLDYEGGNLYWLIRSREGLSLYTRSLLGHHDSSRPTGASRLETFDLAHRASTSPRLYLLSNKLFWLGANNQMHTVDTRGLSLSTFTLRSQHSMKLMTIVHSRGFAYPEGTTGDGASVIPHRPGNFSEPLGQAHDFRIQWDPVPVQYGKVYYRVQLHYSGQQHIRESQEDSIRLRDLGAFTQVRMSVQACTYWGCSQPTVRTFTTPTGVPTAPMRPRCYVEHHKVMTSTSKVIVADFWWDLPTKQNGRITGYSVSYSTSSDHGPWRPEELVPGTERHYKVDPARADTLYYFRVRACTEKGCGPYSNVISGNTTAMNPVSILLTARASAVQLYYPDDEQYAHNKVLDDVKVTSLAYIKREDVVYVLGRRGTLYEKKPDQEERQIITMNSTAKNLCSDWVGRQLFWTLQSEHETHILQLDLRLLSPTTPVAPLSGHSSNDMILISRDSDVWDLTFHPASKSLYWIETSMSREHAVMVMTVNTGAPAVPLFSRRITNRTKRDEYCDCSDLSIGRHLALDHMEEKLYVVEEDTDSIWRASLDGCTCERVVAGSRQTQNIDKLGVDMDHVLWSAGDDLYRAEKTGGAVHVQRGVMDDVKYFLPYGKYLQPMPDYECLIMNEYSAGAVSLTHATDHILLLSLTPMPPAPNCEGISLPAVHYRVYYRETNGLPMDIQCSDANCLYKDTFETTVSIDELSAFTTYMVQVSATNFYMNTSNISAALGPAARFSTNNGVPTAPREVSVSVLDPKNVTVKWRSPERPNGELDTMAYKIMWRKADGAGAYEQHLKEVQGSRVQGQGEGLFYEETISGLDPGTRYEFTVSAKNDDGSDTSPSVEAKVTTYQVPNPVILLNVTHDSVLVQWLSPAKGSIHTHIFEIAEGDDFPLEWKPSDKAVHSTEASTQYNATFTDLAPNTKYRLRMNVTYQSNESFAWPESRHPTAKTQSTLPTTPDPPVMVTRSGVSIVEWTVPGGGANDIDEYRLEARETGSQEWRVVYNGSLTHWRVEELRERKYVFRVCARNALGWSNMSRESVPAKYLLYTVGEIKNDNLAPALSAVFGFFLVLLIMAGLVYLMYRRSGGDPKMFPARILRGLGVPMVDTELATLRELPRNGIQMPNALYAVNYVPTDEDIASLPHIRREQLTLTTFLGSGAFGEVFEGIARNLESTTVEETKVAVKTLRKSASTQEKEQFLKEALLMSTIHQENILGLLGVCLDSEAQFIILELMDGGDLLSYLRVHRSTQSTSAVYEALGLVDMLDMMLDVCNGCCFLEDMHLVHRDLAARNCLVSLNVMGDRKRIVKIGDFGLARDIYKNDYYRKEGEGLMPVKWMSPESLIDGVFTTQSDVWSYGVLVYEILTLGQQPYPTRTNLDVLNFVRFGGRLDKPDNCPDELYDVMRKCWQFEPEDRPSFHVVDDTLKEFRARPLQAPEPHYVKSGALRVQLPAENRYELPNGSVSPHSISEAQKPKGGKPDNIRRSHSLDQKSRLGFRPSSHRGNHDTSGYLEPLVVRDHKYLEILEAQSAVAQRCIYCSALDCSGGCPDTARRLARHSSDCTPHKTMNGRLPNSKPRSYIDFGQGIDSDLPESASENNNEAKSDVGLRQAERVPSEKRLSKKCNGVSYSNIPQQGDSKDEVKPAGHKPLCINTHAADNSTLSVPSVKRSQSFSPRYSTPNALTRSHSNRKSMDSLPKSTKPVSNGAVPHIPKYQNVPYGHDKNANEPRNGFHRHTPLVTTRSFDETTESLL